MFFIQLFNLFTNLACHKLYITKYLCIKPNRPRHSKEGLTQMNLIQTQKIPARKIKKIISFLKHPQRHS